MKRETKQYLVAVIGLVVIIFGLLLVSSVVYAQVGGLNLVASSYLDQDITLNPNSSPYYTFTVNAENPTTFVWQLDGVNVWPDNPYDSNIATGQSSCTLQTGSLSTGLHGLVCAQTDFGDSVVFNIHIVRPSNPTPTPTPYSTPSTNPTWNPNNPTPTTHPFATPTPAPSSILPISVPTDPIERIMWGVFGLVLIVAGSMTVLFRKLI